MKRLWGWFVEALARILSFLADEDSVEKTDTCFKLVDDSVENSAMINDTRYQTVVRDVIDIVNDAVRYSLKTDDEKMRIIISLAVDELADRRLYMPKDALKVLVDILLEKTKKSG